METRPEEGLWKKFRDKLSLIRRQLKEESVASNPRKPVDCCNPPVPSEKKKASN